MRRFPSERLRALVCCPQCFGQMELPPVGQEGPIVCPGCGQVGQAVGGQFRFTQFAQAELEADWLAKAKQGAKRLLGRAYPWAIRLLAPVYAPQWAKRFLKTFDLAEQVVADLGCGLSSYNQPVLLVDGAAYPHLDLVCRLEKLPLRRQSVDGLISVAVLEHTPNPQEHVEEMLRVLKPGGRVLCYTPFMLGYHASPDDFHRWSVSGLRQLFGGFEILRLQVGAGPTSALLWQLQEWLALVLSFGSRRLYRLVLPLTWVLSPLKYRTSCSSTTRKPTEPPRPWWWKRENLSHPQEKEDFRSMNLPSHTYEKV